MRSLLAGWLEADPCRPGRRRRRRRRPHLVAPAQPCWPYMERMGAGDDALDAGENILCL